jgi:cytochrome c oxidase assembly protein Cox11
MSRLLLPGAKRKGLTQIKVDGLCFTQVAVMAQHSSDLPKIFVTRPKFVCQ